MHIYKQQTKDFPASLAKSFGVNKKLHFYINPS